MPIEIELPDGAIAEFPDGLDRATIEKALAGYANTVNPIDRPAPIQRPGEARQQKMPRPAIPMSPGGVGEQMQELGKSIGQAMPPMFQDRGRTGQFAAPALGGGPLPQPQEDVNPYYDVAMAGGAGLLRGGMNLAGLPGAVEWLGRTGINAAGKMMGADGNTVSPDPALPTGADFQQTFERNIGKLYEPKTTAGQYARTIGEFAPGMVMPMGNIGTGAKFVSTVLAPAVASETAGQLTQGTAAEPYARVAGALAGGMLPGAAGRVVSPFRTPADKAKHIATLEKEGVRLTAGDKAGTAALRYSEDATLSTPFAGGPMREIKTAQAEKFTQAALKRAGINAPRATREVMDDGFRDIGLKFEALARQSSLRLDPRSERILNDIVARYSDRTNEISRIPIVSKVVDDIKQQAVLQAGRGRQISGQWYGKLRSDIGGAIRSSADPETREALQRIQRVMDSAVERGLPQSVKGEWKKARSNYRNMLVIEDAVSRAGAQTADGLISPAALSAAAKKQGKRAFVRGQNAFNDLADAGTSVLSPLPQSGTAPRVLAHNLPFMIAGGAIGGAQGGDAGSAATGGLAALLLPALAGRTLMSRPVQGYLGNRLGQRLTNGMSAKRAAASTVPYGLNALAPPPLEVTVYPPGDPRNR